jgi:hypothetical protein
VGDVASRLTSAAWPAASPVAGQADQLDAQALDQRQQGDDFVGAAGVGQGDDVVAGDHAHVAMAGFGRVHEKCRRAGAGQGGGDLVADMPGFAHADHDHAALAGQNQLAGRTKSPSMRASSACTASSSRRMVRWADWISSLDWLMSKTQCLMKRRRL